MGKVYCGSRPRVMSIEDLYFILMGVSKKNVLSCTYAGRAGLSNNFCIALLQSFSNYAFEFVLHRP